MKMNKIRRKFSFWDTSHPQSVLAKNTLTRKPVYMGIVFQEEENTLMWASSCYDGSEYLGFHEDTLDVGDVLDTTARWHSAGNKILHTLMQYATSHNYRMQAVCFGYDKKLLEKYGDSDMDPLRVVSSRFWFEADVIPYITEVKGMSLEEEAASAARKIVDWMKPQFPGNIPRIKISSEENEVCVDMDNHCFMVTLENYRVTTRQSVWKKLIELADEFKKRNLRYCYFSSTPQGGGVALMRHATIRLMRLLGVECHWYVAKPMPEVFVITKRKFHNVLQGVAPNTDESRLTDEDKDLWVRWCNDNFDRYWGENTGVVQKADVIIIDDPQLCAIIPSIKRVNPKCRIIYRSHIEIRADLIAQEGSLQKEVWDFLFSFISKADMFISHPISGFIPPYIPLSKVGLMPAATDQLDGLNKFLDEPDVQYYRNVFNRYCEDQCSPQLKPKRSYFIQVSRFDPSKGIPDVLEAYRIFKSKCLEMRVQEINIPQLVICGNGSIDDPDGNVVYDEAVSILCSPGYEIVREDVCLVRVPHCDQVLNSILRGAIVALQLSHREGFEVKVTEALAKQVPVIAYRTGGIPLQLENDISGYLVEPGNVKKVADLLYELFSDVTLHRKIAGKLRGEEQVLRRQEYYTTFQSTNWLYLVNCLAYKGGSVKPEDLPLKAPDEGTYDCNGKIIDWGAKYVKDFWAK